MNTDIVMKQSNSGTPLFEMETQATFYRRGNPPKGVNLERGAKIQYYAYPNEEVIGIWAEGIHIRVPLADIAVLVSTADKTMCGFGKKESNTV